MLNTQESKSIFDFDNISIENCRIDKLRFQKIVIPKKIVNCIIGLDEGKEYKIILYLDSKKIDSYESLIMKYYEKTGYFFRLEREIDGKKRYILRISSK